MPACDECDGSGFEWLLTFKAPCEVCMGTDDNDTNPSTPNAKKSSGTCALNLDGAACGRKDCGHRRDLHATKDGGSHRWACSQCRCEEFVIGGDLDYSGLADTQPE